MKIFIDTANVEQIKYWKALHIIDGVTTNPTHLSREGGDPVKKILEITSIMAPDPVSVEITESEPEAVFKQAKKIARLAENVVIKIPASVNYFDIIKRLVEDGVAINVTLLFTLFQGIVLCKFGVDYISPFVGRLDDIGSFGMNLVNELACMIETYDYQTKLLAASIRSVDQLAELAAAGVDCVTLPPEIIKKALNHPLTDQGMEKFLSDWQKLGARSFP